MKIKIITSCSGMDFSFISGDTPDLEEALANDLVSAGHAEPLETAQEVDENVTVEKAGKKKGSKAR